MSYCGICDNNNVTFSKVNGGFYCSGCDEIQYDNEIYLENAKTTLRAVRLGKREGWKIYPNCEILGGEPIDDVIEKYELLIKEATEL